MKYMAETLRQFLLRRVWESRNTAPHAAEEQVLYDVVTRFGPPHDGNTDLLRHMIRKAQGRPNKWTKPS